MKLTLYKTDPKSIFILLVLLCSLNIIYVFVAQIYSLPYTPTYIPIVDVFADYLKVVVSYPGARDLKINDHWGFVELFNMYIYANPYQGVRGLEFFQLTHFHMPPLTTLSSLISLVLMEKIPAQFIFYLAMSVPFLLAAALSTMVAKNKSELGLWCLCFIVSYPFVFMLQRGNLFAIFAAFCAILFVLSVIKNKNIGWGLFCLALAVNVRPNLIFLLPALLIAQEPLKFKRLLLFFALSVGVFFTSLICVSSIYPDYSIQHFLAGLQIYHKVYVVGPGGDSYNSSLFYLLKYFFGYSRYIELFGTFSGVAIELFAVWMFYKKRITAASFVLLMCVANMCATAVFGDYHLFIFFLPILVIHCSNSNADRHVLRSNVIVLSTCIFLLSPKNYIFSNGISELVLLNPIIGIVSALLLIHFASSEAETSHFEIDSKRSKNFNSSVQSLNG